MRILFVSPRAWPAVGGMELFLRDLTRELATEHDVSVLTQGIDTGPRNALVESILQPPSFEPFVDGGVPVDPLRIPARQRAALAPLAAHVAPVLRRRAWGQARFAATRRYSRHVAPLIADHARGCDVMHVWGAGLLGAAAAEAAHSLGIPCVFTPFAHRGQWGDDPASAATYRSCARVVALLEADGRLYRELGVEPERIAVCGVCSPGVPDTDGRTIRSRHGIEGPLVLFLGRRTPYKGADLLLQAAVALPDVTFVFLGPGDPVRRPSGARILELGRVDDRERAAWLHAADVLALPSAFEIFPVSILEAWSAGTPALVSDIEPLRELAEGGGAVSVRRDADAIADALRGLLSDGDGLRALGETGRGRWRDSFTPAAVAEAHVRVYDGVHEQDVACVA
jgi:glycosyltransferase involved in cell wall biosynthesis